MKLAQASVVAPGGITNQQKNLLFWNSALKEKLHLPHQ